jgi:tRNA-dihydrouridine synthase B
MNLRGLELGRVFLAPLSGIADSAFRRVSKRFGAQTVYSEMVSSEGLTRGNLESQSVLRFHPEERPIGFQIFGRDPARMAEAVRIISDLGPDFLDINLGCPARKIVRRGAGSALMLDPGLARRIARSVVKASELPVTAKMRTGWDEKNKNGVEIALMLEDSGVEALAVHGRTRRQVFSGRASWSDVAGIAEAVGIPVALSGDVDSGESASRAMEETGCAAVMVGRAAYGRPWLFGEIRARLEGRPCRELSGPEKVTVVMDHLDMAIELLGERLAVVRFRKHLLWYTKGIPGVVAFRPSMSRVNTRKDVADLAEALLAGRDHPGSEE